MKTKKLIRNALAVLTIVFMSAVLCGAGCSNAADSPSSGGSSTSNGGSTSLNAIEQQIAGGSIKDGKVMYSFFANKRGSTSVGSANMRSARAAGGVGFSWSADSSGTLTIVLDSGGSTTVFKFTVTNGSIGLTVTKTGSNTPLPFAPPSPSSSAALNEWEKKLVGKWKASFYKDGMGHVYEDPVVTITWVLETGRKGKWIKVEGNRSPYESPILLWSATSNTLMLKVSDRDKDGNELDVTMAYTYKMANDGKSFTLKSSWDRREDTGEIYIYTAEEADEDTYVRIE